MANLITGIMPRISSGIESPEELEKRYSHFFRSLTIILLGLVLIPMILISLLSYKEYKRLLAEEEVNQLLLNVEQADNTLELFVVKLRSIINFAGHDDRYLELQQPGELERLFSRLRKAYPDFTDIEVIGPNGKTVASLGEYANGDHNYTGQQWYEEALRKGEYISDVFTGFRGLPHFVVAISRNMPDGSGQWVLRVNIDSNTLERYVAAIGTTSLDDIFLIGEKTILQTQPKKYGKRGEQCIFTEGKELSPQMRKEVERTEQALGTKVQIDIQKAGGKELLRATRQIDGTPWTLVMLKEFYNQSERWLSFRNRLFFYFVGCAVVATLVILNISKALTEYIRINNSKRMQFLREAENNEKLASIGRLAAGVAHEINNPLAIISQKAGLMEDYMEIIGDFEYKNEFAQALDGIDTSIGRCRAITHRLLGFARHTDVKVELLDINNLLEDVSAFVIREASYNQIKINFDLAGELTPIFSDRGQLQQVFLNIFNNAIDAIGQGGKIEVTTSQFDSEHVQVEVSDNGCGMSSETMQRIFEPFYTTKPTGKGTGLGMSISYGIIKKLGGEIKVESAEGQGTLFTFILPVVHSQETEAQ